MSLTSRRAKLVGLVSLLGATSAVAGLATWGAFTDSTPAVSGTYAAGTVTLAFDTTSQANRLGVGASGLVPGDTVQRAFDLKNTGTQAFGGVTMTSAATTSSKLDTDTTNGLQLVLDACDQAWTEAGGPAYTYTCPGTVTHVLTSRPAVQSTVTLPGLAVMSPAGVDHLRLTLTFPTTADNTFQGASSTLAYTFTATQRAGSAH